MMKRKPNKKAEPEVEKPFELNDHQKEFIQKNWAEMNLKDLVIKVTGDPNQNGLTKEGRAIKQYILTINPYAKIKTTKYEAKGDTVELDENQKLFIRNNLGKMRWVEMAQYLFSDPAITQLHKEAIAVYDYLNQLDPNAIPEEERRHEEIEYKPPGTMNLLVSRVNKYRTKFNDGKITGLDRDNLKPAEIKNLQALMGYLHTYRFIQQATKYIKQADRELYESSFIRFCYDKPDLLEEEVDNYISLCAEIVTITQIERTIQLLDAEMEEMLKGGDDKKKMSMTFVEMINGQREKLNQAKKTYQTLNEKLVGARSKRIDERANQNATILNLVEAVKYEEKRKQLLKIAEKQKLLEEKEVDKLSNMDQVIALVAGITKERAKYG
jgi:hypothetical protein